MDPCLEAVSAAGRRKPWSPLQRWMGAPLERLGLHTGTPAERIERAVKKEIGDLCSRAEETVASHGVDEASGRASESVRELLQRAKSVDRFPRDELRALTTPGGSGSLPEPIRAAIVPWIAKHERLERRLTWLLDPRVTRLEIDRLDPIEDADQIWCSVRYEFRPEVLYALWGNAIERIAQIEATATFFHSTGKAEGSPVKRTEDTALFYAYIFNWGKDSYHGRNAVAGMNRIHGRYFIHNDGLKYVLLDAAFTILDGLAFIGHRPLTDKERLGYFHAQVELGKAMNIQGLTHSWDDMYGWFHDLNRMFAAPSPQKLRTWQAIEEGFDRELKVPKAITKFRQLAERASMDDTYLSALGLERPSRMKTAFVRGIMKVVAKAREMLPREPYIQSLQSYYSYPEGVPVEGVGEKDRSEHMPSACPFATGASAKPNKGYPQDQHPLLSVGDAREMELSTLTWDEVKKHSTADDLWLVWGGHVYDVSSFAKVHPGGLKILLGGAGRDMTRPFEKAKHTDLTKVFALNFRIGKIEDKDPPPRGVRRGSEAKGSALEPVRVSSETR